MHNKLMILAVAAVAGLTSVPFAAHAQEAVSLTNQAIVELTDPPGIGGRTTVDVTRRWGSDVGQIAKATALLQEARGKSTGNAAANRLLEEAIAYGIAREHKEARLSAQGALYHLCQGGGGDGCDKVPKWGSYTAP
ncbi:MAG TPA: hypothetical protein VFI05_03625 [Nitrospiraceae bacterium]|nr:hypothetical protein [Nitrospiraceae bacterium]